MQLRLLHVDDAFAGQDRFLGRCAELGARSIDTRSAAAEVRLWGRADAILELQQQIAEELLQASPEQQSITWFGSGDFHHVTASLVALAAARHGAPLTIVHFDNHPDWVCCRSGLHCGSWVSHVLREGIVQRVVSLGITSSDLAWPELKRADLGLVAAGRHVLFPLSRASSIVAGDYGAGPAHESAGHRILWKQFSDEPQAASVRAVLDCIETDAVYITIDKDALLPRHARTNWDQGGLSIDGLLAWLRVIIDRHSVAGVDIGGDYSAPVYGGSPFDVLRKRSEAFLDQPHSRASADDIGRVNETSNLELLSALGPLLC